MKHKSTTLIESISDHMISKFYEYIEKYDLDAKYVCMYIYPYNYMNIDCYIKGSNANASTVYDFYWNKNKIIFRVGGKIYIPTERIFMNLIDTNMDTNLLIKYYDMILLHEIGHIIHGASRFLNMPIDECCHIMEAERLSEQQLPSLRKNASKESRLSFFRQFFNLPAEKGANDAVGITIDDIIGLEMDMF